MILHTCRHIMTKQVFAFNEKEKVSLHYNFWFILYNCNCNTYSIYVGIRMCALCALCAL